MNVTDEQLIEEAYQAAVRRQFDNYVAARIDETEQADKHFIKGIRIIRAAKIRALQLLLQTGDR